MRKGTLSTLAVSCLAALFAGSVNAATILTPDDDEEDLVPSGKGWGERAAHPQGKGSGNGQAATGKAKTNSRLSCSTPRPKPANGSRARARY